MLIVLCAMCCSGVCGMRCGCIRECVDRAMGKVLVLVCTWRVRCTPSKSSAFMRWVDMGVQRTALHEALDKGHLDIARYRVSLMACLLASACMRVFVSGRELGAY